MKFSVNRIKNNLLDVIADVKRKYEARRDQKAREEKNTWFSPRCTAMLTFDKIMKIMIFSEGDTINQEMHRDQTYFSDLEHPTPSAFVQARDKIPVESFTDIFRGFSATQTNLPEEGPIIFSTDGTGLPFPVSTKNNDPDYFVSGGVSFSEESDKDSDEEVTSDVEERQSSQDPGDAPGASSVSPVGQSSSDDQQESPDTPPHLDGKKTRQQRRKEERMKKKERRKSETAAKEARKQERIQKKKEADLKKELEKELEKDRKKELNKENGDSNEDEKARKKEADEKKVEKLQRRPHNELHLTVLHQFGLNTIRDAVIQPIHHKDERKAFLQMADNLVSGPAALTEEQQKRVIMIADRGFASYETVTHLQSIGLNSLIRSKGPDSNGSLLKSLKRFLPKEPGEFDVDIHVKLVRASRGQTAEYKNNSDQYQILPNNVVCSECTKEHPFDLHIRVVCIALDDKGNYEYLITTLSRDAYPISEMKALYFKRWPVETGFRFLKHVEGLTYLHARKVDAVIKEVWAKLTMHNFCSTIIHQAKVEYNKKQEEKKRKTKYTYAINVSEAIRNIRVFARARRYNGNLLEVIQGRAEPVRPDREFQRRKRPHYAYNFTYRV